MSTTHYPEAIPVCIHQTKIWTPSKGYHEHQIRAWQVGTNRPRRDGTVPLDKSFEETLEHHGRSYQKHAVTNGVYFGPVDEVCAFRLSTTKRLGTIAF